MCLLLSDPHCYSLSTPQGEDGEPTWLGIDGMSDGAQTSGFNTPDVSRPGTPEEVPNIPAGERDGLPLPSSSKRGRTFAREAAKLVALHKAKTMFKSKAKRKEADSKKETSTTSQKSAKDPRAKSEPLLKGAMYDDEVRPGPQKLTPGGGVLSALLKLYEQPQSERSSQATLVPSAANSPPEASASATGFFGGANALGAPESVPTPQAFANEVQRRANLHLNGMLSDAGTNAELNRISTPQLYTSKQNGILNALQQSTASMTGAASPNSTLPVHPTRGRQENLQYVYLTNATSAWRKADIW